jgi:hypothetical protein
VSSEYNNNVRLSDTHASVGGRPSAVASSEERVLKQLWNKWKAFGQRIADLQARILLTLVYFIIVAPFGLLVRLFSDPLVLKHNPQRSMWFPKHNPEQTLESARRQF